MKAPIAGAFLFNKTCLNYEALASTAGALAGFSLLLLSGTFAGSLPLDLLLEVTGFLVEEGAFLSVT